ncbi:4340_t:CDS:2 [Funneliformis geosporum]|uniref:3038_t:CDS:1 n=1 Tax=Funneliformis geosporum TaxID=1117311 RepID=A0A9W4SR74_9GLOM|nr:4340_t:CDS:2 [Funneliformis geosporum]CAI2178637.1 3038_t:CDS:2 [Funneliformis geosporum]
MTTINESSDRPSSSAQEVGWIFVREYYKHLNENPESLCLFYNKESKLIRGLEGEEVKICQGQQEIRKNIDEMQLKDASIKIINVDSLDFLEGKVVVQVTGEISNKDEAYKKFVRTVILAKPSTTDDNYHVYSDIFRYLKNENVDSIKQQSIHQESSYIEDGVSTVNEEKSANGEDAVSVSTLSTLAEESAQDSGRDSKVIEESPEIPPTKANVNETSPLTKPSTEGIINIDGNATENEKPNSSDVHSKGQPGSISVQTEKLANTSNATNQSPTQSQSPSKPSSWANLAASDSQKWGNTQLAEPKGRVVTSTLPRTQSQQPNRDQRSYNNHNSHNNTINRGEFSLYVKGVVEGMNKDVLDKVFTEFGVVKHLDVVITKSCAFVEFDSQRSYQQALNKKVINVPNFGNVTVEERRHPREEGRNRNYYPRNNYNSPHNPHNGNGINSQRGSGNRGMDRRNTGPRHPSTKSYS